VTEIRSEVERVAIELRRCSGLLKAWKWRLMWFKGNKTLQTKVLYFSVGMQPLCKCLNSQSSLRVFNHGLQMSGHPWRDRHLLLQVLVL
jgi:hypothetical protein